MKKAYLSIDLDFWAMIGSKMHRAKQMIELLEKLKKSQIPTTIVMDHKHLAERVNRQADDVRTLVNMDYHSDLAVNDVGLLPLNEGTWINFIKWSKEGTCIWVRPKANLTEPQSNGRVDKTGLRFGSKALAQMLGWKSVRSKLLYLPKDLIFVEAGVSISPGWIDRQAVIYAFLQHALGHPVDPGGFGENDDIIDYMDALGGDPMRI